MRNRILRLAALGAVLFTASATAAAAQVVLPRSVAAAPAYEVTDRLLDYRPDLALTGVQVARLTRLSTDLRAQAEFWRRLDAVSSKPWLNATRRPSPRDAVDRALAAPTPERWQSAVRLLTPLLAQEASASDTLLARLTAEAIAANPSLVTSRAMARAATARIRPAGALPDPTLSAGVMDLTLPKFGFRESDFTEVDVELSQEFPWPGTLGARTAQARAEATAREADAAARRREVVVRTAELYYRLRYAVTARSTLGRQRALLSTGVDISTARYATTSAPQSDPLQARVALARLDTEEADLAAEETTLRADLKALRNVAGPDSLPVEPIRPPEILPATLHPVAYGEPALPADSLPEHPRLVARRAAVEAADQAVRVERLGARPDFTFMTRYGARPLGSDFFSAFVGVRLPLFAGRKQFRLADAARAEADAARAALDEERAALASEIRSTVAQVQSDEARLRLLVGRVVPSAEATVGATLRSYRVGHVEFLTVLATEDALYRSELDAARVAAEHLTHLVMLDQLLSR